MLTLTHDTVNKCAPLELAAIIGNAARLKEQVQTWCVCVELIGIHAHFSASLKLLESCYPVVRNAALHADLILAALYQSGSVVLPSQHEFEDSLDNVKAVFPVLDDNLQALFMSAIKPVLILGDTVFDVDLPLPKRRIIIEDDDRSSDCIIIEDDDRSSDCTDHAEPFDYSGMPALLSDSEDSVDEQAMSDEEGNLWNAVPPLLQQAAHGSSTSSGSTGSSDGSLSDDFIDKSDPAFTFLQEKVLMRFFPILCKDMFMVD